MLHFWRHAMPSSLNKAVAGNTDSSKVVVATRLLQRIGIDLLRGGNRAFHGRLVDKSGEDGGIGGFFIAAAGLAAPANA